MPSVRCIIYTRTLQHAFELMPFDEPASGLLRLTLLLLGFLYYTAWIFATVCPVLFLHPANDVLLQRSCMREASSN